MCLVVNLSNMPVPLYMPVIISRDKCQHTPAYSFFKYKHSLAGLAYAVNALFGHVRVSISAMQHVTYVTKPAHLSYPNHVPERNQWPYTLINITYVAETRACFPYRPRNESPASKKSVSHQTTIGWRSRHLTHHLNCKNWLTYTSLNPSLVFQQLVDEHVT